jgi:hypothetical protein
MRVKTETRQARRSQRGAENQRKNKCENGKGQATRGRGLSRRKRKILRMKSPSKGCHGEEQSDEAIPLDRHAGAAGSR